MISAAVFKRSQPIPRDGFLYTVVVQVISCWDLQGEIHRVMHLPSLLAVFMSCSLCWCPLQQMLLSNFVRRRRRTVQYQKSGILRASKAVMVGTAKILVLAKKPSFGRLKNRCKLLSPIKVFVCLLYVWAHQKFSLSDLRSLDVLSASFVLLFLILEQYCLRYVSGFLWYSVQQCPYQQRTVVGPVVCAGINVISNGNSH